MADAHSYNKVLCFGHLVQRKVQWHRRPTTAWIQLYFTLKASGVRKCVTVNEAEPQLVDCWFMGGGVAMAGADGVCQGRDFAERVSG